MHSQDIPTIDLDVLKGSDPAAVKRAGDALRDGFGTYGLVFVKSHGVDKDQDLQSLYDRFTAFVERPEAEKEPYNAAKIWYQRGWTPANVEKAVVAGGQPDFKECYFASPTEAPADMRQQYPQIYADNVWPEDDVFRNAYMTIGQQLHRAGNALLQLCALSLDLDESTFTSRIEGGPHVFRVLRYGPVNQEQLDQGVVWGEEHTDFNLLTLLPGGRFHDPDGKTCARPDDKSGLYLRTRPTKEHPQGEKIQGTPPAGCIVVQVGQQLEILTGGTFLATPHVITAPSTPGYSRLSAAHFMHLHSHQMVFPLPPFQTTETIDAYCPPVLAGTYSLKTLVDIGLAPSEALDGLGYRQYDRLAQIRKTETAGRD